MAGETRQRAADSGHARISRTATVADIGIQVGYDSEAAFSRAFKRAIGRSPADFRRERQQQPASRPA
jgi:AraC-like DNA-binding protein